MAVRFATRAIARVSSLVLTMKQQLADKSITSVPGFVVEPAKSSFDRLASWLKSAEVAITKRGDSVVFDWTAEDLEREAKMGIERSCLLGKMLDTARKHA